MAWVFYHLPCAFSESLRSLQKLTCLFGTHSVFAGSLCRWVGGWSKCWGTQDPGKLLPSQRVQWQRLPQPWWFPLVSVLWVSQRPFAQPLPSGNVLAWGWGRKKGSSQFSEDLRCPSGAARETKDETRRHPLLPGSPSSFMAGVEKQVEVSWQNHLTACQGLPVPTTDDNRRFLGSSEAE